MVYFLLKDTVMKFTYFENSMI